jgi:uncharacterized protein (DUF983 family)
MDREGGDAAPAIATLLWRGLAGRCPRCGRGRLFDGFLKVAPACPVCRLGLAGHDAGDGPAVAATFILGTVVVGLAALLELTVAPPLWVHAVLWGPLVVGGSIGILRPLKGATIAIQYRYRSVDEPTPPGGV